MDLPPDGDIVFDVDILFVGTAVIVPDVSLPGNVNDVPFRVRASHFYLEKILYGTVTVVKTL